MKRKLDTRFPAARIKKIMQADEDVGKIAMAVPLLVSKALELFLQELCDRTYEITLMRGAKTINSLHLKQCVQGFDVFDFLREIVRVPDLGGSDAAGEDRSVSKRRKVVDNDSNASDDQSKGSRKREIGLSSCGRGRSRGRGRGRGRGSRIVERERADSCEKFEDDPDISHFQEKHTLSCNSLDGGIEHDELKNYNQVGKIEAPVRNFDLNVNLNENGDSTIFVAPASPKTDNIPEKDEEYHGWLPSEIDRMAIDPIVLANLN